jgi:hypothetical protein
MLFEHPDESGLIDIDIAFADDGFEMAQPVWDFHDVSRSVLSQRTRLVIT